MSARVFKPIGLNDNINKLYRPSEPTINRLRNPGITRVRRSLFGPINHVETQRFLEEELAKESRNSADKWQFNFAIGKPLDVAKEVKFIWEAVKPQITYAPVRNVTVIASDNEQCYPRHLDVRKVEAELEMETAVAEVSPQEEIGQRERSPGIVEKVAQSVVVPSKITVQSRMTDFMQVRKRSADSAFVNKKSPSSSSSMSGSSKLKISRSSNNLGS